MSYSTPHTPENIWRQRPVRLPGQFCNSRKGLRMDLRTSLREAVETGEARTRENISIESEDGRVQMITLTIVPAMHETTARTPLPRPLLGSGCTPQSRGSAQPRRSWRRTELRRIWSMNWGIPGTPASLIEEYQTALEELKSSTRSWSLQRRNCNPPTKNWRLRRRSCSRSTRNCTPSIPT